MLVSRSYRVLAFTESSISAKVSSMKERTLFTASLTFAKASLLKCSLVILNSVDGVSVSAMYSATGVDTSPLLPERTLTSAIKSSDLNSGVTDDRTALLTLSALPASITFEALADAFSTKSAASLRVASGLLDTITLLALARRPDSSRCLCSAKRTLLSTPGNTGESISASKALACMSFKPAEPTSFSKFEKAEASLT